MQRNGTEKKVTLKAPLSRVWQAIADAEQFGRCLDEASMIEYQKKLGLTPSGVRMPPPDTTFCAIEHIDPERDVSFRWIPDGIDGEAHPSNEPTTLVEFFLESVAEGNSLTAAVADLFFALGDRTCLFVVKKLGSGSELAPTPFLSTPRCALFAMLVHTVSTSNAHLDPELLRRLLRAKDRMDAASHEAWPVHRLARVSGVSEAHFARSFKQAFGVPPHRYLLTRRVERTQTMLRDTDLSITEIAFDAGWKSLGSFGRTFRDITGESPGTIRERERKAMQRLDRVPPCFLSAGRRPDLTMAASEKRRLEERHMNEPEEKELA